MKKTTAKRKVQVLGESASPCQVLSDSSSFVVKEAYKTLRTNIRFALRGEGCKKICITSGLQGEGKSITLLNLAISFAQAGQKVLLIDADLRRPAMARLLAEKATPGLTNMLAEIVSTEKVIRKGVYPNLDVILSGDVPPNPSELLSSEKMHELIESAAKHYDYILVDTPPVNVVSDACIVANILDGVLFVVRQEQSRKDAVKEAVASLQLTGARILGFVLNGIMLDTDKRYRRYE